MTSGAAAGLLLGTAACVTGLDPGKMNRLPDTSGMKNEVIMARSHRNFYDHAVRSVGIELVEVGIADRFSGAGIRDAEGWEIEAAITERTAAIVYVAYAHTQPSLEEVVAAGAQGRRTGDCGCGGTVATGEQLAALHCRWSRFWSPLAAARPLVGRRLQGILCGRRDLIAAAALQHQDLDVMPELWEPPASLIDKSQLPGAPQHGIGRPCKVGKEEIAGLVKALRLFVAEDPAERRQRWYALMEELVAACGALRNAEIAVVADRKRVEIPTARLVLDEEAAGTTALELVKSATGRSAARSPLTRHMCTRER